ncbi:hypothetical protein H8M03_10015 [Sphingomonas sabuli]|uniref:DUF4349 domain-containing protein n=1 Tax=Sphingomonas sabuli TaxID=2764186 RepID=A0A7G9L145_9SPHN|nr:hypothetical protein [Sphingomonas sabuli]QNM82344.1 hypothetical protein H8M03_10015 [Sphingomonas sabuli]
MKTWHKTVALGLLAAGCSQGPDRSTADDTVLEREPPAISPTAAPGVAFRYDYVFQLADEQISGVQERHASRCEALGAARCRITGMRFAVDDDDAVSASLEVKLAPDIARAFGKQATADVTVADGKLSRTEFSGTDTEPVTSEAGRREADVRQRIADLEKQLATASAGAERAQLQAQLNGLRSELSGARATVADAQAQLARTPMEFTYFGRGGISGFRANPLREAARMFVASLVTMIDVVLRVLAVLLPWLALVALVLVVARTRAGRRVRRLFKPDRDDAEPTE